MSLSQVLVLVVAMATILLTAQVQSVHYAELVSAPSQQKVNPPGGPAPSENYTFYERLSDDYTLYWEFNATHITFEMIVKTNGWVGLGISPNGAMKNSDVVIGWVKDGQVYFADRHAEGHFLPARDKSQDWTLLMGQEIGQYTILKVTRLLDTCDDQDAAIKDGTTRLIYSYSKTDPPTEDAVSYHGNTRGTKSVFLLDPLTSKAHETELPSDVKVLEFRNGNVSVPSSDTTYWCTLWTLPDLGGKNHIIRYEPIIQPGHERLLHHVLIYYCSGRASTNADDYNPDSFRCFRNQPSSAYWCDNIFVAWAIGGKAFIYPEHTGYPLGGADDPGFFMMETHYDNPSKRSDYVDDSGMRLYLTQQLRQHDAGMLTAGVDVSRYHIIPPYQQSFLSQGFCEETCLSEGLGDQEIYVFANLLHAHLMGSKLRTRHFRNGTELPPIQEDNNYDFNYQESRYLSSERTIRKGDSLLVECQYDSSDRTAVSFGGLSTREEMCLSFLLYYPRTQHSHCTSRLQYNIPDRFGARDIFQLVRNVNWIDSKAQEDFQQIVNASKHKNICYNSQHNLKASQQIFDTPEIKSEYHSFDQCAHN